MEKEIFQKLLNIQQKLNAPKNLYNKFGGYSYRSCESILEAVKPLLNENGVVLTISDEVVEVGNHNYIRATACLVDSKSGDGLSVSALAREAETKKGMDDSQITGATSSYARKYALNGLFAIDDNKDADSTNTHVKDVQTASANPAPAVKPERLAELNGMMEKADNRDELTMLWSDITPDERRDAGVIECFKKRSAELK